VVRKAADILKELTDVIDHVHKRPGMYGDADQVDATLHTLHWCWAMVQRREEEFQEAFHHRRDDVRTSNVGFADAYRRRHPNAKPDSVRRHILGNWKVISERLGIRLKATDPGKRS
jgi:hypothetical protein